MDTHADSRRAKHRKLTEQSMVAMLLLVAPCLGLVTYLVKGSVAVAVVMTLLVGFVPLMSASYYVWRRRVRKRCKIAEWKRLGEDASYLYHVHGQDFRPWNFFLAVFFTTAVTAAGIATVLDVADPGAMSDPISLLKRWGDQARAAPDATQALNDPAQGRSAATPQARYQHQALIFFGVAFLGSYLWGLQNLLSRYFDNDLLPGVYYSLGMRMIFAALLALILFHALPSLEENMASALMPATALLIGMFPNRALRYLTDKLSLLIQPATKSANELPLEIVQGVSVRDRMRLAEAGVLSTFDLATTNLLTLLATTPYRAEKLIDWILQAKLALAFPDGLASLRANGIRTVLHLEHLDGARLDALVSETRLTRNSLELARIGLEHDPSVVRLRTWLENLKQPLAYDDADTACNSTAAREKRSGPVEPPVRRPLERPTRARVST